MSYSSLAQMVARYSEREIRQLTDHTHVGAIDEARVARALEEADALIDARLRLRYQVPVNPVPIEIQDIAEQLTRWKLFDHTPPVDVLANAKMALAELDRYADGRLLLDATSATGGVAESQPVEFEAADRVFTRKTLRRW